jgi:prepilin-type N-terminal cleavage/methylation domain-containing protein
MTSMSIGTPVASRSSSRDGDDAQAGFTLIEALVAMALLLAFVSVLGPYLFHARRIADNVDGRVAAQVLLRAILDRQVDRTTLAIPQSGETDGLRWSVTTEPAYVEAMVPAETAPLRTAPIATKDAEQKRRNWLPFRVTAKVEWADGHSVSAETLRLGLGE